MFHMYSNPEVTGWLGWFEDSDGNTTAFVGLDRKVTFMYGIMQANRKMTDAAPVLQARHRYSFCTWQMSCQ